MHDPLDNPYWESLATKHAAFAIGGPLARRYPADVIPFGGIPSVNETALTALRDLIAPGEKLLITSDTALLHPDLKELNVTPGLQMVCPPEAQAAPEEPSVPIVKLHQPDIPAMLALKAVAFPSYFGPRAPSLGSFYGIRIGDELVAMAGERLALPDWREISAVCTHPAHTGKGYAAALIRRLMREHGSRGVRSFLGVDARNARAIALYTRLGFEKRRTLHWRLVARADKTQHSPGLPQS